MSYDSLVLRISSSKKIGIFALIFTRRVLFAEDVTLFIEIEHAEVSDGCRITSLIPHLLHPHSRISSFPMKGLFIDISRREELEILFSAVRSPSMANSMNMESYESGSTRTTKLMTKFLMDEWDADDGHVAAPTICKRVKLENIQDLFLLVEDILVHLSSSRGVVGCLPSRTWTG